MSARGDQVRAAILQTGLMLWQQDAALVTARGIGAKLGLTHAGCLHHYKSSARLKDAVAAYAVHVRDRIVVPQLIVARHPAVESLTPDERAAYLAGV